MNVLACLLRYVAIIIPIVVTLFLVRYLLPVPHEVFRKVLHAVAFTSTPLIMWLVGDWCVTCLTLLMIGLEVRLLLLERQLRDREHNARLHAHRHLGSHARAGWLRQLPYRVSAILTRGCARGRRQRNDHLPAERLDGRDFGHELATSLNEHDGSVTAELQGIVEQIDAVIEGLDRYYNGRRFMGGFHIADVSDVPVVKGELDFKPIY